MDRNEYREMLIRDILEWQTTQGFSREVLERKPTRILERIYDNLG